MPIETIQTLLKNEDLDETEFRKAVQAFDHFEIARILHAIAEPEKLRLFHNLLEDSHRQELLYETDKDSRNEIIRSLDPNYVAKLLGDMEEDEATDILKEQDTEVQDQILKEMEPRNVNTIKNLIRFDETTAGGMMSTDFLSVPAHQTAATILMRVKKETNADPLSYFYVLDKQKRLLGFFKLRDLLHVPPSMKAIDFVRENNPKVELTENCEKVAALMDQHHLSFLPVVDESGVMQGVVTFDDVIRVMEDIVSEDIYTMVGSPETEPFAQRPLKKVAARLPWLLPTFFGGIISAAILHRFEVSMAEFGTVIFFIPFVLGLAGNIGLQGATVIVRGWATGDIRIDNLFNVLRSEIWVGCLNGAIFGLLCGISVGLLAGPLLNASPALGLAVGIGIVLAVTSAAFLGSSIPALFLRMEIDPAISTGPIFIVVSDIVGLFIYMSTAMLVFIYF